MSVPGCKRSLFARIRKIWAIVGSCLLVLFFGWSALAYRANAEARTAIRGDAEVSVRATDDGWLFSPTVPPGPQATQLLFFPGGLVDPVAYAPLLRAVAAKGHVVTLASMPRRGAFGGAEDPALLSRAHAAHVAAGGTWIVAGHSRGGKVAALYANRYPDDVAGLVLIGTSHPRDISLADARFPVLQVLATRDPIASISRADRNRRNLPAQTTRIVIAGGNHSQFGDYGFQPGDFVASIPHARQRQLTRDAVLAAMTLPNDRNPQHE